MPGALTLGASTADNVNFGVGTGLGDLSAFTFIGWFKPTALTSQKTFYSRHNVGGNAGKRLESTATGGMTCVILRATSNLTYTQSSNFMSAGAWNLMACVVDLAAAAGSLVHIYRGGLGVPASEGTYSATTDGAGTQITEVSGQSMIGGRNLFVTPDRAWVGEIGPCAVFAAALSLADVRSWQVVPRLTVGANAAALFGRPGKYGADWIEYTSNTGTPSGATQADGPPVGTHWSRAAGSSILTRV